MHNFDEIMKQFATKVVDENNPVIFKYVLKEVYRRKNITLIPNSTPTIRTANNAKAVSTPFGDFKSFRAASVGCNITPATLYKYLREQKEGYTYL